MTVAQQQWNVKMGQQLLARAMKDETFRQELLTNPKMLIEHELGVTLPQDVTIQVHEDTPTTIHLVLPRWQFRAVEELSDADLEHVASRRNKKQGDEGPDEPNTCVCFYTTYDTTCSP